MGYKKLIRNLRLRDESGTSNNTLADSITASIKCRECGEHLTVEIEDGMTCLCGTAKYTKTNGRTKI